MISLTVPFMSRRVDISCMVVNRSRATSVEETLKRIQAHKGVIGTIVVNSEGIPIRTTLDNSTTVQYCNSLTLLTQKARGAVRDIDPQNDLTFLRVRSKKNEIMVAPANDYLFVVVQGEQGAITL